MSVTCRGVVVKGSPEVFQLDQVGEIALRCRLNLAGILTQLGRDIIETKKLIELLLGLKNGRLLGLTPVFDRQSIFIQRVAPLKSTPCLLYTSPSPRD